MIPTYGLAEHCVFVCSDGKQVLVVDKAQLGQHRVEVLESFAPVSVREACRSTREERRQRLPTPKSLWAAATLTRTPLST